MSSRQLDGITWTGRSPTVLAGKTCSPQLGAMLNFVRDGDTVIVHSMDRLARKPRTTFAASCAN